MRFGPFKRLAEPRQLPRRRTWRVLPRRSVTPGRASLAEDVLEELAAAIQPHELHPGDTDATLVAARDILRRARERNRLVWPLALHLRSMFAGIPVRDGAPALAPIALPMIVDGLRRLLYRAALGVPIAPRGQLPEA